MIRNYERARSPSTFQPTFHRQSLQSRQPTTSRYRHDNRRKNEKRESTKSKIECEGEKRKVLNRFSQHSSLALRSVIAGLIILLATVSVLLVTPWYQVSTTQELTQTSTSTLTSMFIVSSTNYQTVTIYSLPNTVQLPTPYFGFWLSHNFTLQAGQAYSFDASVSSSYGLGGRL